jgi:hypothetical protein
LPNGELKTDLKLPVEDEELYKELKETWDNRGESTVHYTVQTAVGQNKIVSGRKKD